jgi:hypothetical protein
MGFKKTHLILANVVLILHTILVLINVIGFIAILINKFSLFRKIDVFGYAFLFCLVSTLISAIVYKSCLFTIWENRLRESYKPGSGYTEACMKKYAPCIPVAVINHAVKILVFGALIASVYWEFINK